MPPLSPQFYRNELMTKICEAIEALVPGGAANMPVETEKRIVAIYKELSEALGLPEGKSIIDDDY
jgi:hypothetical protein